MRNNNEVEVRDGSVADHMIEHEKFDFSDWLQARIKDAPWWGISAVFHIILILIAGAIILSQPAVAKNKHEILRLPDQMEDEKIEDIEIPTDLFTSDIEKPPKDEIDEANPTWKDAPPSDRNRSDDDDDADQDKGDSYDFISDKPNKGESVFDMFGVGPDAGGDHGGPRGDRIDTVVNSSPHCRRTIKATLPALYWLAKHQNPDGSWGAGSFQHQCADNHCNGVGDESFNVGLTGLALLAFTGANYTPGSRDVIGGIRFGNVVCKAAQYLKSIQKPNGMYGGAAMTKFMYNQSIAAYAMADLYCVMKDKSEPGAASFKQTALEGVVFIISAQNPGKAWRYQSKCGDNDMSVSGWCMMALKTAEDAGLLEIPQSVWVQVTSHLDDVTDIGYGGVGYIEKGSVAIMASEQAKWDSGQLYIPPSLTAIGIMSRIFMGQPRRSAVISNSAGMLTQASNLPEWETDSYGKVDYYYWFYGSYALNQYDGPKGPVWRKWEEKIVPIILDNQKTEKDGCACGSWDPIDRWSGEGGRVYATAINILTLEVYYRLGIVAKK